MDYFAFWQSPQVQTCHWQDFGLRRKKDKQKANALVVHVSDNKNNEAELIQLGAQHREAYLSIPGRGTKIKPN